MSTPLQTFRVRLFCFMLSPVHSEQRGMSCRQKKTGGMSVGVLSGGRCPGGICTVPLVTTGRLLALSLRQGALRCVVPLHPSSPARLHAVVTHGRDEQQPKIAQHAVHKHRAVRHKRVGLLLIQPHIRRDNTATQLTAPTHCFLV